ncbi:hypothetical protein AB0I07_10475, partial [Polymorphospora rubra]
LLVPVESDRTYDLIMTAVAELELPLHRLDQRRARDRRTRGRPMTIATFTSTGHRRTGRPGR